VEKIKSNVSGDDGQEKANLEKNKKLKKECQDILDKFKKVEEDYKSSIENMQIAYKKRKKSFDTETNELRGKQEEVEEIKSEINKIEDNFKEIDEIIRVKKEQKDLFLKIANMMETNYNEYIKHCKELGNVFLEKHFEFKRYQQNSKNISQVLIEALEEINVLENKKIMQMDIVDNLKKTCKKLRTDLS
jgi:DNA repair exonuclease SbcCD ATPase subunit